ncbi:ubiquinone biosynthesis accessory factor UbiJ [Aestuariirhabdus sp. LZHN29]|uniref:ubiquinone biosynthesis accessory factor UbiJ n=1 Tax=Aestuariirhabdus sp. LZHN29 TaxID=3417462 RepID=UPI003CEE6C22
MIDPTITMAVLASAESTLNALLRRDPPTLAKVTRLEGRVLHIQVTDLDFDCFVHPDSDGVRLLGYDEQPPRTSLFSSSSSLLRLLASDNPARTLHESEFRIEGDAALIIELQQIALNYELDLEGLIATAVGDVAAHSITRGLGGAANWLANSNQSLQRSISEYLQEELELLPSANEVECFTQDLQQTQLDLDRLEARIEQLQKRLNPTNTLQD